jgi:two-component system cell cycle sensor histidine kinase/response regulator CckA
VYYWKVMRMLRLSSRFFRSKASITTLISIMGALAACVFAITIPSVYYAISINGTKHTLTTEAAFLAKSIEKVIQARPDLWEFENIRLKELLTHPSIHEEEHEEEIRTASGKLVTKTDFIEVHPTISVTAPLFDSGRLVGSIVINHSIRTQIITTAILGMASSLLGYIIYFLFRTYPISTLEKTLMDLKRERDKSDKTLYAIGDGVITIDHKGKILFMNRVAESLVGMDASEAVGQQLEEVYVLRQGKVTRFGEQEYILIGKRGSEYFIEEVRTPLTEVESDKSGFVIIFRNITERKEAEEEKRSLEERLNRSEKMEVLGQLAGGVAHDLNNVLGVLTGYSELLLGEIAEGSRSKTYVDKILQSTEKGAAIIQDLLTLARRGVTVSDVINLNIVVLGFLKTPVFEKMKDFHHSVTFRTELEENLLNIKGSPVHLEKTLMNLVSNAAEAVSSAGQIMIRTENCYLDKPIKGYEEIREGDYAVLIISDTGIGISAEDREKIFEPFYTKKKMGRSGTGLGLSVVWGTVKDHKGYIDLQTEVGKGTTFTLYFPVTREELIEPEQKTPVDRYTGRGESVLIVDDITEQREIASRLFTQLGYEIHSISSGEGAVEYLKGHKADILVLDMIMTPGIDGLETYQRVLEINPKQKAILVSGFSETERVREAQKLGAGAYVKKPYVLERIGIAIRDELARK